MELRELRYFLAVAQAGTISRAAESLNVTQPTLSRQLAELESRLGKTLFLRGKRRITLTDEGLFLHRRAQEILALVEKTEAAFADAGRSIAGDVFIGGGETEAMRLAARAACRLRRRHPHIVFHIFSGNAQAVGERLKRCDSRWEDAFFVTLARNFGFGLNSDAFEAWALRLPFRAVDKHRDSLFQVEALFFGTAGLLDETSADDYARSLCREYAYLSRKFSLSEPLPREQWRFLRLRPAGFPHVRLAQLASIYHREQSLLSRVLEAEQPDAVRSLFNVRLADYWTVHYSFGKPSARRTGSLSRATLDLLVLNTVVPFLYAYGLYRADDALCDRALRFLETLQPENNRIIRSWAEAGLAVQSAADSQAVLQLQKEYCDKRDCLRCRFGYEYLKARSAPRQSLTIDH